MGSTEERYHSCSAGRTGRGQADTHTAIVTWGTESEKQCLLLYLGPSQLKHDFLFPFRLTHVAKLIINAADSKPWETLLWGTHCRWEAWKQ